MMALVEQNKCATIYRDQFPHMSKGDQASFVRIELEAELNRRVFNLLELPTWDNQRFVQQFGVFGTMSWAYSISRDQSILELEKIINELVLEGLNAEQ